MSIDRSAIGRELPGRSLLVTRSRLRNFAKATGQRDPIYTDVDAAKQATSRVADIYDKKGGLLEFVVRESTITNQDGAEVVVLRSSTVVRHRPGKDQS